jgi:hypothetical protein
MYVNAISMRLSRGRSTPDMRATTQSPRNLVLEFRFLLPIDFYN